MGIFEVFFAFLGQQILEIQDGKFGKVVPVDVICAVAGDLGISTNLEEFEQIMQQQKVISVMFIFLFTIF